MSAATDGRTVLQCVCGDWQVDYAEREWATETTRLVQPPLLAAVERDSQRLIALMVHVEDAVREHADECLLLRAAFVARREAVHIVLPDDTDARTDASSDALSDEPRG